MTTSANSFGATGSNTESWKDTFENCLNKQPKILEENILQKALEQIDLTTFLERKYSTLKLFKLVKRGYKNYQINMNEKQQDF